MKTCKIIIPKSALDTQSLLYLNATGGGGWVPSSLNQHPKWNQKIIIIIINQRRQKHNTKKERSSNQPLQSCAVLRLHNIYKPKETHTIWYCTGSPAVLSPLHFSKPPNYGEAQINNMLLIYTRRWRYKIEIITVHVQHAGLIFNAGFLFQYIFEYNQAGNKSMRCCIKCPPVTGLVDRSFNFA